MPSLTWSIVVPISYLVSTLALLIAAGLSLSLSSASKASRIWQFLGFLLLAISSSLSLLSSVSELFTSVLLLLGALSLSIGYTLARLYSTTNRQLATTRRTDTSSKTTSPPSSLKQTTKQPGQVSPSVHSDRPPKQDTPVQAKITPLQDTRRAIKEKTGLPSTPLIKLPSQKRKKIRQTVNVLIGFVVFILVGWGSYSIAKRIISPESSIDKIPIINDEPSTNNSAAQIFDKPTPLDTVNPGPSESKDNATPENTASTENTTTPEPKTTVTIKETETGYLNVRDGASTATAIITTIKPSDTVEFIEENTTGDWYKIKVDDNTAGWISAKYATKNNPE